MFTQACFIKNYKRDLISKIENIGYRNYGNPFQFTDFSILYTTIDGYYVPYKVQVDSSWIDCGTNEELFLAIAALRDDSDIHQWFIMDAEIYTEISKGDWFVATDIKGGKHVGTQIDPLYCHKATVEELIKHYTV